MSDQNLKAHNVMNWEHAVEQSELNAEFFSELAQMFLEEAPKLMEAIRNSLEQNDASSLKRAAHTLKSSAAIFEAQPTVLIAQQMEEWGLDAKLEKVREALPDLEREINRLLPALSDHAPIDTTPGG